MSVTSYVGGVLGFDAPSAGASDFCQMQLRAPPGQVGPPRPHDRCPLHHEQSMALLGERAALMLIEN
jgi:hypothetical protein